MCEDTAFKNYLVFYFEPQDCPLHHGLEPCVVSRETFHLPPVQDGKTYTFFCDSCSKTIPMGTEWYGCISCNFGLCMDCHESNNLVTYENL